jgi:hypothetical protein
MKLFACIFALLWFMSTSILAQKTSRKAVVKSSAGNSVDTKMNSFISSLMAKMTLDEKIGQLNLLTPGGGVATGSVVSSDVESKIKAGSVGGLFGVIGVDRIRQAQELAVNNSALKNPVDLWFRHHSWLQNYLPNSARIIL